jgi:hypothetical protein
MTDSLSPIYGMTARLCDELMTAAVERRAPKSLAEIMVANPSVVLADNAPANPDTAYDALYDAKQLVKRALDAVTAAGKKHAWSAEHGDWLKDTESMLDDCLGNIRGVMASIEEYGE